MGLCIIIQRRSHVPQGGGWDAHEWMARMRRNTLKRVG
jgi:hypothetical protein